MSPPSVLPTAPSLPHPLATELSADISPTLPARKHHGPGRGWDAKLFEEGWGRQCLADSMVHCLVPESHIHCHLVQTWQVYIGRRCIHSLNSRTHKRYGDHCLELQTPSSGALWRGTCGHHSHVNMVKASWHNAESQVVRLMELGCLGHLRMAHAGHEWSAGPGSDMLSHSHVTASAFCFCAS